MYTWTCLGCIGHATGTDVPVHPAGLWYTLRCIHRGYVLLCSEIFSSVSHQELALATSEINGSKERNATQFYARTACNEL